MKKIENKNIIFVVSIVYTVLYRFVMIKIPAFFPLAYETGDLLYQAAITYFTGFIFYLLVEYYPRKKDQEIVYDFVGKKRTNMINNFESLFNALINEIEIVKNKQPSTPKDAIRLLLAQQIDISEYTVDSLDNDKVERMCEVINPRSRSPFSEYPNLLNHLSWYSYFKKHTLLIKNTITDIFTVMPYLKTDHVKLLADIQESNLISIVNNSTILNDDDNLKLVIKPLQEYYSLYKKIKEKW